VIAHLLEENYDGDLVQAVQRCVHQLHGSYALLTCAEGDGRLIAVRSSSPLVIGVGDKEAFAASDLTPLLEYTERVIYLEDGDIAALSPETIEIFNDAGPVERNIELIDWTLEDVKKGGFKHYMQKEIFEQPQAFSTTIRALRPEDIPESLLHPEFVTIVACGTSFHAGMILKYLLETFCSIPSRVELGSEFKYYTPPVQGVVIGITQSGETADTLAALKAARACNCTTIAVTNVLGSSVTRIADHTLYLRAGPEISVAATKSFIAQLAVILQIVNTIRQGTCLDLLLHGNRAIEEVLLMDLTSSVLLCRNAQHIFFVGRGPFYPVALEGALKMKEISYIHAEGYAAGELKHGPFALLSGETPVIALCMPGETYQVMLSNIKEMKARGAPVVGIGLRGDTEIPDIVDVFIPVPETHLFVQILTTTVVLQLLAYLTADALGCDIDKPRNLAKSVTVE
jgi:glucosamine--fructose-6-phosphate aminotransferase (isomerizing)